MNEEDMRRTILKTEQAEHLLAQLWEQRISILNKYFDKRKGRMFRKGENDTTQLQNLDAVHRREQHIIAILGRGINETIDLIEHHHMQATDKDLLHDESEFLKRTHELLRFLESCGYALQELQHLHQTENTIIHYPTDEVLQDYIEELKVVNKRIQNFTQQHSELLVSQRYFKEAQKEMTNLHTKLQKKPLEDVLLPSAVSASVRVLTANLSAAAMMQKNPLHDPNFWEFTWKILLVVYVTNILDYYFKLFTKMSRSITKIVNKATSVLTTPVHTLPHLQGQPAK